MDWLSSIRCPWGMNLFTVVACAWIVHRIWSREGITKDDLVVFGWAVWAFMVNVNEMLRKLAEK